MTRKAWSHVRILIYRTWAIVSGLASETEVLDRAQLVVNYLAGWGDQKTAPPVSNSAFRHTFQGRKKSSNFTNYYHIRRIFDCK